MQHNPSFDRFFKLGVGLVAWGACAWAVFQIGQFLMPIVILFGLSLLFTYILLAPVNVVERLIRRLSRSTFPLFKLEKVRQKLPRFLPRAMAILLVYLLFTLSTLIISVRFIPTAFYQLNQFATELPRYVSEAEEWALNQPFAQNYFHQEVLALRTKGEVSAHTQRQIEQETNTSLTALPKSNTTAHLKPLSPTEKQVIRDKVFNQQQSWNDLLKQHFSKSLTGMWVLISTTLAGIVYTLTGIMLVFYFLLDGKELSNHLIDIWPKDAKPVFNRLVHNFHDVMYGFVKGQVMLGLVTGVFMIVIYSLFGVPYALFLGSFFALAEILPVVGTWIGFLPGILVLLFTSPFKLITVMAIVWLYQTIKDNIVAPRVLGGVLGLHPVAVIISLLVCAKIAGLVGVLFAIPLASMLNVLIEFMQEQEQDPYHTSPEID